MCRAAAPVRKMIVRIFSGVDDAIGKVRDGTVASLLHAHTRHARSC